jgi:ADP-ribose pyrophosphatase YjhB (NUDIX family)
MTDTVTPELLHDLVAGSHAQGVTDLAVEAAISHDDQILLVASPGPDFTDQAWQLPAGLVLPGQTLTDALDPAVAAIGLTIQDVTGYLGHHDHAGEKAITRVFRFAVTVTDPGAICRHGGTGHSWTDSPAFPPALPDRPATTTARRNTARQSPFAVALRACARGIYPDEAGVELLISHGVFLHRADFTSRFITSAASGGAGTSLAAVDWPAAIAALDDGLPCSGGEQRMLRVAASLADGIPVNLRDALTGIDGHGIGLVVRAVLHAAGHPDSPGFHDHL